MDIAVWNEELGLYLLEYTFIYGSQKKFPCSVIFGLLINQYFNSYFLLSHPNAATMTNDHSSGHGDWEID